ncbi:MAG TPA: NAD(P)-dependent oxidoreductase, partial [Acidobacteriaceae bacterium]|nr:NAD(P)-dependent oxidoreductase [Acidobacteriaceae bacterium]
MKVAVTGSAGRVGRSVTQYLSECGHDVLAIDRIASPHSQIEAAIVDLTNICEVESAFRGVKAVVHMARVPFPYSSSGYDAATRTWRKPDLIEDIGRFNLNLAMIYNVFGAALAVGATKLVIGSSLAVYGFYYPSRFTCPDYLPIDESHALRPDDHYGLSKRLGEALADGFASKHAMDVVSLRFPVIFEGDPERLLRQQATAIRGFGAFGTYLDVRDAARVCRLALEAKLPGHEVFNVCAPTTLMTQPTSDLALEFFPGIADIRRAGRGNWSGYDVDKVRNVLG